MIAKLKSSAIVAAIITGLASAVLSILLVIGLVATAEHDLHTPPTSIGHPHG